MKKIIFALVLVFSFSSWSQESKKKKYQKDWYDKAQIHMEEPNNYRAMKAFFVSYKYGRQSDLGKKALQKMDSLRPIARNELIRTIQGEWKLKKSGSNWGFTEVDTKVISDKILVIKDTVISFFKQERSTGKRILVKSEVIRFYEERNSLFPTFTSFVFSDKNIWKYYLKNDDMLRTIHTGEATENGRTEIVCGNSELYYERIK